jgi:hypothetical protein
VSACGADLLRVGHEMGIVCAVARQTLQLQGSGGAAVLTGAMLCTTTS